MPVLELPNVTLCSVTSVNVAATLAALRACMDQISFAETILFTDIAPSRRANGIRVVPIPRLTSAASYSSFVLSQLGTYIRSTHCLIVQWDGFVIDATMWDPAFLNYDYIGAPWPQFDDGHDVGNGGFSLRSKRLLDACSRPDFVFAHPEDVAVGRLNRAYLEQTHQICFADRRTANRFAFERSEPIGPTFGFHGVFNLIPLFGPDAFWSLYRQLDEPHTVFHDYPLLLRQLNAGRQARLRQAKLTVDWLRH